MAPDKTLETVAFGEVVADLLADVDRPVPTRVDEVALGQPEIDGAPVPDEVGVIPVPVNDPVAVGKVVPLEVGNGGVTIEERKNVSV